MELRKIETAVGGKTVKSRTLYVTNRPTGSSFYKINPYWAERISESAYYDLVKTKQLSVRTLSDVIQKDKIDLPDFMKLDTFSLASSIAVVACSASRYAPRCTFAFISR